MNRKDNRGRYAQMRNRISRRKNARTHKRAIYPSALQIISNLIEQFNSYCMNLETRPTYEFDNDEQNNHRCKMTLPIFPNLQTVGDGAKTKKEAKANCIIAFLAHLEKRREIGLFVPYVNPNLVQYIQAEIRRAVASTPNLLVNENEYLLDDRLISKHDVQRKEKMLKIIQRICGIRVIRVWQSTNMGFIYLVGSKAKAELIRPYIKALYEPECEQMFIYGEKLSYIFSDEKFLDDVCQRLKVLCSNENDKFRLFIYGSSVNMQICYNEFIVLRRAYETEISENQNNLCLTNSNNVTNKNQQFESKTINNNNDNEQLPDYSIYDDDVNASMLRVLQDEENSKEDISKIQDNKRVGPIVIELSDDSADDTELKVIQTVEPKIQSLDEQLKQIASSSSETIRCQPVSTIQNEISQTKTHKRCLRHIVLDGQNIGRNSNDYDRSFSWSRLSNAISYFTNRGHENIIAFLPLYLRDYINKNLLPNEITRERQVRDNLINLRYIAFTPSRYNNGHRLTNYDDRFILQYAADNDGIVVSNDNFRDLRYENAFKFIIDNRILPFATINDTFMPATDPLGRNGPNLDEFLSKPYL